MATRKVRECYHLEAHGGTEEYGELATAKRALALFPPEVRAKLYRVVVLEREGEIRVARYPL